MTTRVVINGKEVTNPVAKAGLISGFVFIMFLISVVIIFVFLPLAGIVITLSVSFVVVFMVTIIAGITALVLSASVFNWLFGPADFRIEKTHRRNY